MATAAGHSSNQRRLPRQRISSNSTPPKQPLPKLRALLGPLFIALACALCRYAHITHGLPDFVEEAIPLRTAMRMRDWVSGVPTLNPHYFNYPSCVIYIHVALQQVELWIGQLTGAYSHPADMLLHYDTDPTILVVLGRSVSVVADVLTALAVYQILRPRGGQWALLGGLAVAFMPSVVRTGQGIFVDSVASAAGMWSLQQLIQAYCEADTRRSTRALVLSGAFAGLAISSKYPWGILLLLLPLVAVTGRISRTALALALTACAGAFLATSPFVIVSWSKAVSDIGFEVGHASFGQRLAAGSSVLSLMRINLGWLGVAVAIGTLPLIVSDRIARITWMYLGLGLLLLCAAHSFAERYMLLVLPPCAVLIGLAGSYLARRAKWVAVSASVLVLLPIITDGAHVSQYGTGNTQVAARQWIAMHLQPGSLVLQDAYGVIALTSLQRARIVNSPDFASASAAWQRRFLDRPTMNTLSLPVVTEGHGTIRLAGASVALPCDSRVINGIYYERTLFGAADYILLSNTIRDRAAVLAGPRADALYGQLGSMAVPIARFAAPAIEMDPDLTLYRVERAAVPKPLWWALALPDSVWRLVAMYGCGPPRTDSLVGRNLRCLAPFYQDYVRDFVDAFALGSATGRHFEVARNAALGAIAVDPSDAIAFRVYGVCIFAEMGPVRGITSVETLYQAIVRESPSSVAVLQSELADFEALARRP